MDDQPAPQKYYSRMEWPVQTAPQRVISLVPSLTEALFDLDLGLRLVAITDDCTRPPEKVGALRRIGASQNPDIRQIIALKPDLVLVNDEENRREDMDALREANIPLWVTGPRSVFDALNLLWNLMDVFDHAVMIPRVREIERAYDYSLAASMAAKPLRVFVPLWRDPWITFNAETYAHDILKVCGGINVFAEREQINPLPAGEFLGITHDRRYPQVTLDDVIAAQPDVVLLPVSFHPLSHDGWGGSEQVHFTETDVASFMALAIPAAQHNRIHLVDGSLLTWHGTRIAYALRDLPPLLSGDSNP